MYDDHRLNSCRIVVAYGWKVSGRQWDDWRIDRRRIVHKIHVYYYNMYEPQGVASIYDVLSIGI